MGGTIPFVKKKEVALLRQPLFLRSAPSDPLYERFDSLEYSEGAIEETGEIDFLALRCSQDKDRSTLEQRVRYPPDNSPNRESEEKLDI